MITLEKYIEYDKILKENKNLKHAMNSFLYFGDGQLKFIHSVDDLKKIPNYENIKFETLGFKFDVYSKDNGINTVNICFRSGKELAEYTSSVINGFMRGGSYTKIEDNDLIDILSNINGKTANKIHSKYGIENDYEELLKLIMNELKDDYEIKRPKNAVGNYFYINNHRIELRNSYSEMFSKKNIGFLFEEVYYKLEFNSQGTLEDLKDVVLNKIADLGFPTKKIEIIKKQEIENIIEDMRNDEFSF